MGNQINWMTCSVSHCRDVEEAKAAVCLDGIRQKQKLQHVLFYVRLKFTRGVSTGTLLVNKKEHICAIVNNDGACSSNAQLVEC